MLTPLIPSICFSCQELERLYQKAAQMPEEQKLPHTHATEQRDQYTQKDMAGMK